MQRVLNAPVTADSLQHALGLLGQAGDVVLCLAGDFILYPPLALDHNHGLQSLPTTVAAQELEMLLFRDCPALARLNTTVSAVHCPMVAQLLSQQGYRSPRDTQRLRPCTVAKIRRG